MTCKKIMVILMPCPPMNVCGEVRNNINWENNFFKDPSKTQLFPKSWFCQQGHKFSLEDTARVIGRTSTSLPTGSGGRRVLWVSVNRTLCYMLCMNCIISLFHNEAGGPFYRSVNRGSGSVHSAKWKGCCVNSEPELTHVNVSLAVLTFSFFNKQKGK